MWKGLQDCNRARGTITQGPTIALQLTNTVWELLE